MTSNQIAYRQAQVAEKKASEEARHNREMERENRRHNLKEEAGKYGYYGPGSTGGSFEQRTSESPSGEDMWMHAMGSGLSSAGKVIESLFPFKITFKA